MVPLRLVIDTNIVISAALKAEALPRTVVVLALAKPARWYVSEPLSLNIARCWCARSSRFEKASANNCCN